jgi:hypothetical protein
MPRLPAVTLRQLVEALEKVGFEIDHQALRILGRRKPNRRIP